MKKTTILSLVAFVALSFSGCASDTCHVAIPKPAVQSPVAKVESSKKSDGSKCLLVVDKNGNIKYNVNVEKGDAKAIMGLGLEGVHQITLSDLKKAIETKYQTKTIEPPKDVPIMLGVKIPNPPYDKIEDEDLLTANGGLTDYAIDLLLSNKKANARLQNILNWYRKTYHIKK